MRCHFAQRLDKIGFSPELEINQQIQVLAQRLGELERVCVSHSIVFQNVEVVRNPAKAWIHISKVVEKDLINDCSFALAWVPASVKQAAGIRADVIVDEVLDGPFLLVPTDDQVLPATAKHVQQRRVRL